MFINFYCRLCHKHNVKEQLYLQDPNEPSAIEIYGSNVGELPEEELKQLKEKFKLSDLTTHEQEDESEAYTEPYVWEGPVIAKYEMSAKKWNCEMLVRARDSSNNEVFQFSKPNFIC